MAAALIGKRKIVPTLASTIIRRLEAITQQQRFVSHCITGQHVRRRAAAEEKSKCFIPHSRRYGAYPYPSYWEKLSYPTGHYYFDLAVDKAIQHYHEHIKVEEEDGRSITIYPVRAENKCIRAVKMFQIILKIRGGEKYVSIFVAPEINRLKKLDDEALKLLFFTKVDRYIPLPFRKFVGRIRWPVCPRNDPLIAAAARFALAQHNKEEKLAHLIRATSQMVGEHEMFRMTFKGEFSGESSMYDAVVLIPRKNPEKMELVMFRISNGWGMYGRWGHYPPHRDQKEDDDDEDEDEYQYEDDKCLIDDPRVTAAARFALNQYNETDQVRLDNKKDQVRRVVGATRRTYSGDEIFSIRFDGELDGSWFYEAIVLVPVNDPENMRLAYCGRNYDDPNHTDECECEFDVDENGFYECRIDDPQITEAARVALAAFDKKDKLVRVVKASRRIHSSDETYYIVRFVGEDDPLRTYLAMVSVPRTDSYTVKDPTNIQVKRIFSRGVLKSSA